MFLNEPPPSEGQARMYEQDVADDGYVSNSARVWAWRPDVSDAFTQTRKLVGAHLSLRERGVMVCALTGAIGDSYCALAWGRQLAKDSDPATAAAVLRQQDAGQLSPREKALAAWARRVARAPNDIAQEEVDALRRAGLTDQEVFDATVFIALRLAFSTVNDALGARPDALLAAGVPAEVRAAVTFGRRPAPPVTD
jgi:uncharacterized peroxidase-related enzyme